MDPVVVGISGGSGALLARKAIDALLERNIPVLATASSGGRQMWHHELEEPFSRALADPTIDEEMVATVSEAHQRGAFGVPTFFVGEHMFWGNDRMVLLRHFLLKDSA